MNNHALTPRLFTSCCLFLILILGASFSHAGYNFEELEGYLNPEEKTISMDFNAAPLTTVLKLFSRQSGMNFIASADVEDESVSLFLEEVPVEAALERILSANGLTYEVSPGSNIFVVKRAQGDSLELMTRVYPMQHVSLPSSHIFSTLSDFEGGESDPESDFGLLKVIEGLLSEDGSVVEDRRTNSLIITDLPNRFPLFEQTISRLDVRVPMVLIEVEMLDVAKNHADLIGAKWGASPIVFSGATRKDLFPFDFDNIIADNISDLDPGMRDSFEPFKDTITGVNEAEGRYGPSSLNFRGLAFTLQFLRTQVDTRSLARPRILTLNNQKAEISIERNEAIAFINTSSGADTGTESANDVPEREPTGVFLTVTPSANVALGEITMAIEPRVVDATGKTVIGDKEAKNPETRGSKSILRVKNGDTIIIGGLLATAKSETKTKVPFLSSIPIVGSAFRHTDNVDQERELIIFITPQIIKDYMQEQPRGMVQTQDLYREQNMVSQVEYKAKNQDFLYFNER